MVQCAMCIRESNTTFDIEKYGQLPVCWNHYEILTLKKKMKDMLIRIIESLNQKLAKVPLDKTPGQTQYNRGMRVAFRLAVGPVEKELERLIKE